MEYSITYTPGADYILITLEGAINVPAMRSAIEEAGRVILEHGCNKILGDFRKTLFQVSVIQIMDLYAYWVSSLNNNKISQYSARRAILLDKDQKSSQNFHFFETVAVNRSSSVKIFLDMDEAVNWLSEK